MSTTPQRRAQHRTHLARRRMTAGLAALAVVGVPGVVATAPAYAGPAAVLVVTTTADDGPGSLREVLALAAESPADDRITFETSGTIQLTSGQLVAAVGGGTGDLVVEGPGRDDLAVDAGGSSRVLDVRGSADETTPTFEISGVTLRGGRLAYSEGEGGGGLRAADTHVLLRDVVIVDNRTGGDGWSPEQGGGVSVSAADGAASLRVEGSTVAGNAASGRGGGLHAADDVPMTVEDSVVRDNTAASVGRGMEAAFQHGDGGGIAAGTLTLVDSTVAGNRALQSGGGLWVRSLAMTGSTVSGNSARDQGGGILLAGTGSDRQLRLTSSTVGGNRADRGGGVHVAGDLPVALELSTVAGNAAVSGGGLSADSEVGLRGTIVAMNTGGDLAGEGSATLARSLVQDPGGFAYVDDGGSVIGEDPLLAPAGTDSPGALLPAPNSPVIDQGSAFGADADQRGLPRPVDDVTTDDAADGSDVGAVELSPTELAGAPQVGSTARPVVTGRARVGETLRTDGGRWAPEDVDLAYQWLRDGEPIPGATAAAYTLTPDDFGRNLYGEDLRKRVSVRVTAAAAGHRDGSALSDPTDHVVRGRLAMAGDPRVVGRSRVGSTLRARPRTSAVSPRPTSVTVRWFVGGRVVTRAVGDTRLVLRPRMRGERVRAELFYWAPQGYRALTRVVRVPQRVR